MAEPIVHNHVHDQVLQDQKAAILNVVDPTQGLARTEARTTRLRNTEKRSIAGDVPLQEPNILETEHDDRNMPQPASEAHHRSLKSRLDGYGTKASVSDDGRVNIRINQHHQKLSKIFKPALQQQEDEALKEPAPPPPYLPPSLGGAKGEPPPPQLNVVIQIVGSRGDVQPFIALGKVLQETYSHRVRIATHPNFRDFVTESGLEFFSIGGDPSQLMAFMVKNPGLIPGFDSIRSGVIGDRKRDVEEYVEGCWRSCLEPDDMGDNSKPFVADCIIANPPSFAHIHCAEKLGIPLHIMFTMPYSPTQAFAHPLTNIQSSNADPGLTKYISYALVDTLTWQGLGSTINRFRQKSLKLEPISLVWAVGILQRLKIPHTYCWSPSLIPKPKDWGPHISIAGFSFLNLASDYVPPTELEEFLGSGPPPVYIGFGSIVLEDPDAMTALIFEAVRKSGQRVLLSKGWGGMGVNEIDVPNGIFMLGNCPHDWLFKKVSCVVHHGGAGTTAAGISAGRPTLVIPFFGDQPFWGSMMAQAGAGPKPIPHKQLTADKLAEAIKECLKPERQARAQELAVKIASESGSDSSAQFFHQFLEVDKLRCNVCPSRTAAWCVKRKRFQLSAFAAYTLAEEGLLDFKDMKPFRPREYITDEGPVDPFSGGANALVGAIGGIMVGVVEIPIGSAKALKNYSGAVVKKTMKTKKEDPEARQAKVEATGSSNTSAAEGENASISSGRFPSTSDVPRVSRLGEPTTPIDSLARVGTRTTNRSDTRSLNDQTLNGISSQSSSRDREILAEFGASTGKSIGKVVNAGVTSPMTFSLGLARGLRNAPKLYGDKTVREHSQVTGLKSGLKAASTGFGLGVYDGITGLVRQPLRGAQKEGAGGFIKGVGQGIGVFFLKPGAGMFGLPAYSMQGLYKELMKLGGNSLEDSIMASRIAQGYDEWQQSSEEERRDVIIRWKVLQQEVRQRQTPQQMMRSLREELRKNQ